MEDTNRSQGAIKVIWEILPGDSEYIFKEFNQDDLDPDLFTSGSIFKNDYFPTIPHPLLKPTSDCLDRVWTQTVIKIDYQSSEWSSDENEA